MTTASLKLWEVATGRCRREKFAHNGEAVIARFTPDGKSIITGGRKDGFVRIWDAPAAPCWAPSTVTVRSRERRLLVGRLNAGHGRSGEESISGIVSSNADRLDTREVTRRLWPSRTTGRSSPRRIRGPKGLDSGMSPRASFGASSRALGRRLLAGLRTRRSRDHLGRTGSNDPLRGRSQRHAAWDSPGTHRPDLEPGPFARRAHACFGRTRRHRQALEIRAAPR